MTRPAHIIAGIIAALCLLFAAYMGSYYAMLEGQDVDFAAQIIFLNDPSVSSRAKLHANPPLAPKYRLNWAFTKALLWPAHRIDQSLAPAKMEQRQIPISMKKSAPIASGTLAALLLLVVAYMGSYFAMLEGTTRAAPLPTGALGQSDLRLIKPSYRSHNSVVEIIFRPAHELDRLLRPGYWAHPSGGNVPIDIDLY